jgi:hypothetical protein
MTAHVAMMTRIFVVLSSLRSSAIVSREMRCGAVVETLSPGVNAAVAD